MSSKCVTCEKNVYPSDPRVSINSKAYHAACFFCEKCRIRLDLRTYRAQQGRMFCSKCIPVESVKYGMDSMESQRVKAVETVRRDAAMPYGMAKAGNLTVKASPDGSSPETTSPAFRSHRETVPSPMSAGSDAEMER